MQVTNIRRVSFYWSWIGGIGSSPSSRVIHLANCDGHFIRRDSSHDESSPIDTDLVVQFLDTLRQPPIPTFDPHRMGLTRSWLFDAAPALIEERARELPAAQADRLARDGLAILESHPDVEAILRKEADSDFNSFWTNDSPHLRAKVFDDAGNTIIVESASQHAFMLPWTIHDVMTGNKVETYDADIGRAVARLLPDDFPTLNRLGGRSLINSVLWEALGDRMEKPHLPADDMLESLPFVAASRPEDCSLLEAVRTGQANRIETLVGLGANVEAREEEGRTPLILAVLSGNREILMMLLAAGADVEGCDKDGDTPLLNALPQSDFMRSLLGMFEEEEPSDDRDHLGIVRILLQAGADPNGGNSRYGTTPMLKVSEMKKPGALCMAQLLIEAGASVNVADDVGQTALMHAAFPPFDAEMFELLAGAGADTEARRNDGCTGLVNSAAGGEERAAQAWIQAGADVNAPGPNGNTPLMLASRGWPNIVEMLLQAGADVNAADDDGDTPLHFAVAGYRWSAEQDKAALAGRLLKAGANASARNRKGQTALADLLLVEREQQIEEEVRREFRAEAVCDEPDVTAEARHESELCKLLRNAGGAK